MATRTATRTASRAVSRIVVSLIALLAAFVMCALSAQLAHADDTSLQVGDSPDIAPVMRAQGGGTGTPWGPLRYRQLTDGTIEITGYVESSTDTVVTIPDKIKHNGVDCYVTSIQYGAFRQNDKWEKVTIQAAHLKALPEIAFYKCTNLQEVILPGTVESVGKYAFYGCSNLKKVTLGDGVKELGPGAFKLCSALEGITLPGSLTSMGEEVFSFCPALKSIAVPSGVAEIPKDAFKNCKALATVTLDAEGGSQLKTIGEGAFDTCSALATLTIPDSVTTIGKNAFRYAGLTKVNLPSGLVTLGEGAFGYCSKLADIGQIPATLTNIGSYAFSNCGFEYLALPDTITSIPEGMFFACSKMKSIALPDTLLSIGKYAFASCKSLEYLRVPKGVITIGNFAFKQLDGAKMVYFENGDKNWTGAFIFGESKAYQGKGLTIVCGVGSANAACKSEAQLLGATFKTLAETGSYTVKHDKNGGSGTMADVVLPKGFAYAVPLCAFTHATADFRIWEAPNGVGYHPGQALTFNTTTNMTVMADWDVWAEGACTITFKANGGTGDDFTMSIKRGGTFTLPTCPFGAPNGKTFDCWMFSFGGGFDFYYHEGAEVALSDGIYSLTVKAQWVGQYTVTFDPMGGTVAPATMKTNGAGKLGSWPTATKAGYVLEGWSTTDDSAGMVSLGRAYHSDTTLHAVWEPMSSDTTGGFLVMFDPNGGSLPVGKESALTEASGKLASLPTPTRDGYTFDGWYLPDGTTKVSTSTVFASATTVTAKWTEGAPAVETQSMYRLYNPNSGEHFYTANAAERDGLVAVGWKYEGVGWTAPKTSSTKVYRLYSGTDHHYTSSASEKDWLVTMGWKYEGVGWYSDDAKGVPLYRQFNPNVDPTASTNNSGSHNYTTSKAENDFLVSVGWQAEGVGWYGVSV